MESIYLEFKEKLAGSEDESARPVSLADDPPIALLLTAPVQPAAWYLCISSSYHQHTAPSIELLQEAGKTKLHLRSKVSMSSLSKSTSPNEKINQNISRIFNKSGITDCSMHGFNSRTPIINFMHQWLYQIDASIEFNQQQRYANSIYLDIRLHTEN